MNRESQRHLQLLEAVEDEHPLTQRGLASRLGMAVGLTNLYLKRLARKGFIKVVNVRPNRVAYLLTPKGIAEKTRLMYEFMESSMSIYRHVRMHLRTIVVPCLDTSHGVAIYGTGEAAELAYLCLKEIGVEPVAVFDREPGAFLGMPVYDIREHHRVAFDSLIVAKLDRADGLAAQLVDFGVDEDCIVLLRPQAGRGRHTHGNNGKLTEGEPTA